MDTTDIDVLELKGQLARQGTPMWKAASSIGVSPPALSHYLCGRIKAPPSLRSKLEKFLGLEPGALKRQA
jgi:hypothetical protein